MRILNIKEIDNSEYYSRKYTLNQTIQVDSLIYIAKLFESSEVKMSECHCSTFDEDGYSLNRMYLNIDDISDIASGPSPYISFSLNYCDRLTMKYRFSLSAYVNSNVLTYKVDKKSLNNIDK